MTKQALNETISEIDGATYDETAFNPDDELDKKLCDWLLKTYFPEKGSSEFNDLVDTSIELGNNGGIRGDKGDNCGEEMVDYVFNSLLHDFPAVMNEYDRYYGACEWAAHIFYGMVDEEAENRADEMMTAINYYLDVMNKRGYLSDEQKKDADSILNKLCNFGEEPEKFCDVARQDLGLNNENLDESIRRAIKKVLKENIEGQSQEEYMEWDDSTIYELADWLEASKVKNGIMKNTNVGNVLYKLSNDKKTLYCTMDSEEDAEDFIDYVSGFCDYEFLRNPVTGRETVQVKIPY